MTDIETETVWTGAEALRPLLVPLGSLHTHPNNPRRGDVPAIAASLARFGQVRAILAQPDGTIVAGNHTFMGAAENGWTHVAATLHEFRTAEDARAYLLADNRLGDLGTYDSQELAAHLADLEASGRWDGTGYTPDDLAHFRALEAAAAVPPPPEPPPVVPPTTAAPPELREVVLLFDTAQAMRFAENIRKCRADYGLEGVTDTILRVLRDEAFLHNQGVTA